MHNPLHLHAFRSCKGPRRIFPRENKDLHGNYAKFNGRGLQGCLGPCRFPFLFIDSVLDTLYTGDPFLEFHFWHPLGILFDIPHAFFGILKDPSVTVPCSVATDRTAATSLPPARNEAFHTFSVGTQRLVPPPWSFCFVLLCSSPVVCSLLCRPGLFPQLPHTSAAHTVALKSQHGWVACVVFPASITKDNNLSFSY